jgi:hypothetical protein
MSFVDAAPAAVCERGGSKQLALMQELRCAGLGIDAMADAPKRYWFVAGVLREPHDLLAPIGQLRASGIPVNGLLIVANHRSEDARKAVDGSEAGPVPVVSVHGDEAMRVEPSRKLSPALGTLLAAMRGGEQTVDEDDSQSQVYAQLRQDIADGAVVLFASVADPDEQLVGARILLRANCECVLTHEIAA